MAAVSDTAEGSGESQLTTWLIENKLSSLLKNDRFTQQELTLEDFLELNENELQEFLKDDLKLGVMEQKKFKKAIKKLQGKQGNVPQKKKRIKIVMSEVEENAINNVEKEEEKYDKYIENIHKSITNTKHNAKNGENMIEKEFRKIFNKLNERKNEIEKELKNIENQKLKMYNNNLQKAIQMKRQLKNIENEWNNLFENINIHKNDRKKQIRSESQKILSKSRNLFKNEIIHSVNDTFNITFNSTQNYKYMTNIGRIDGNEAVPQIKVLQIMKNNVDIYIEFKSDIDCILLYGLKCEEMNEKECDEKKEEENECKYVEFKENKYSIKNLKYQTKYSIKTKAKISPNLWTNYSKNLIIQTMKKNTFVFESNSLILTNQNEIEIFKKLLRPQLKSRLKKDEFSLRLLYRNSRDGNSGESFHNKCNGYSNTIVLVHSNFNHIFGGFTTYKWQSVNDYKRDDNAFLFLLRSSFNQKARVYKLLKKDNHSVYDGSNHGPCFGNGFDLGLHPGDNNHCSNLGSRYEGAGNELCGGDTHKTNSSSSPKFSPNNAAHYFQVKEYEVFVVS